MDLIAGFLLYFLNLNIHVCALPTTSVLIGLSSEFLVPETLPGAGNLFLKMGPVPGACCLPPGHQTPPACKISQRYLLPASPWVPTAANHTTSFCSHSLQRPPSVSQSVPALSQGLSVCFPGACPIRVGTPSPRC